MGEVFKSLMPNKGQVKTLFVASDWHLNHINYDCLDILIQHAELVPRTWRALVIAGDFLDCPFLMKKNADYQRHIKSAYGMEEFFVVEAAREFKQGNNTLDLLMKTFPEIYFMDGNHDWRYWDFMNGVCPSEYRHNFDLPKRLKLEERGIPYVPYNDWLDVGSNLTICHGSMHGKNHNEAHFRLVNKSVIYGHVHHSNSTAFKTRGKSKKAWSLPCMADKNPVWIKNRETNWDNGFGVINLRSNSTFNFHIHEIWDRELTLPTGKRLKATDENTKKLQDICTHDCD